MNTKPIIFGAVSGFASALLIDLHAWSQAGGQFNWPLAVRRWIYGGVAGALTGAGFNQAAA